MLRPEAGTTADPLLALANYRSELGAWCDASPETLALATSPTPDYDDRVDHLRRFMGELYDAGWSRYGWPTGVGGLGGTIIHRATMWEVLATRGVPGMALFEHLEVLAPTLVHHGPTDFIAQVLPDFLSGRKVWSQGFSEPGSGSDLASVRTTATTVDDGYTVTGHKIWTSWSKYASWCLVLARTGSADSRHRGLTALVVDLESPGVDVRPITQANGTDELAEVFFDEVYVPSRRMLAGPGDGWRVAMHILSHERGTLAWFKHLFFYHHLHGCTDFADTRHDSALGNAFLDLTAVTAAAHKGLIAHADGDPLGPHAAFTKLLLCESEQATNDWILAVDPDLAGGIQTDEVALRRQEYLFSRIVTVYGGSQQMQLDTIAKQILQLP
ncbi:MAG: acyl-CoA dehydrogenase family protein [Acidimicrobiales bacterium]|nr:acyl-CoA dehydrogenase family protein [Acidimicrobiales bacterium]